MITQNFYALVLFPYIKYDEKVGNSGYTLIRLEESNFWNIKGVFLCDKNNETYVNFQHRDFSSLPPLPLWEGLSESSKNWHITWDDQDLVVELIKIFTKADTWDFHFFKDKEFYDKIPFWVVLTITSKCNLFCDYCFNDYDYPLKGRNTRKWLWLDDYTAIVDKLHNAGARDIILTGWEPFVAPFFWELMDYLKEKRMFIRINTNGTLLKEKVLERLNENYVVNLMVSMHEFNNKDYFDINRVGAKNTQGLEGIKNFENKFEKKVEELKKVKNFRNLSLDFLTILTPKNILFLEKLYAFTMNNFEIGNWHFFRLYSTGTTKWISRSMINLAVHKLYKLNKVYNTDFKIVDSVPYCITKDTELASKVIDGELSDKHNVKTIITTDGNIQIMSAFDSNLGSIFDHDISEVWKGEYVQKMLNNGFLPDDCQDCKYKETCRGGSRMDANIYNGSYGAFDPLWDVNNKVKA